MLKSGDTARFQYGGKLTFIDMSLVYSFYDNWMTFCSSSQAILSSSVKVRCRNAVNDGLLLQGKGLASLLFGPEGVPEQWFRAEEIHFTIDEDVAELPFEILVRDGLILSDYVPLVRNLKLQKPLNAKRIGEARDFVACGSPRHAHAPEELSEIEGMRKRTGWSYISSAHLGRQKIVNRLLGAKRFHYAGHSCFDHIDLAEGERIDGEALSRLDLSGLDMAFLNSCRSACLSDRAAGSGYSLVRGMLEGGVSEVIGYGGDIVAIEAVLASGHFWDEIERGGSASHAVFSTRKCLREAFGNGCLNRVLLQHYGSSSVAQSSTGTLKIMISIVALVLVVFLAENFPAFYGIELAGNHGGVVADGFAHTRRDSNRMVSIMKQGTLHSVEVGEHAQDSSKNTAVRDSQEQRHTVGSHGKKSSQLVKSIGKDEFDKVAEQFITYQHPFLNQEQRIDLVRSLMNEPMPVAARILRLKSEMGVP